MYVYKDRHEVLVTDDMGGSTRPVEDVYREVLSDLRMRPCDHPPPPPMCRVRSRHRGGGSLNLRTGPRYPPPPAADDSDLKEDQQTATPNPGLSRAQFLNGALNKAFVDHKLQQAQRLEDREQNLLASKELLDTTTLEEKSITNASSLPQPTSRADKEANVMASNELLDTTTPEEESITNASSLPQTTSRAYNESNVLASMELLETTTLEESITNASSQLQPSLPLKEKLLTPQLLQALDKARDSLDLWCTQPSDYSYDWTLLEAPNVLSSKELAIARATLGRPSVSKAVSSSTQAEAVAGDTVEISPPISARKPAGWNKQFFIRVDLGEAFHTYPQLGGPFRNLEDAEKAILRHLDEQRDPKMCTNDGLSGSEIAIRDALYWPDGTRKKSSRFSLDHIHIGLLLQALLDKHNEENNLLGDRAYQVEDVVSFQDIYEGDCCLRYYHLNFTRKTKGGAGCIDNLLFAEVLRRKTRGGQAEEFELSCLHMVKPADNGPCYGCTNEYSGMKHPSDTGKYKGGHDPSYTRCSEFDPLLDCFPGLKMKDPLVFPKDMDARLKAEEARIRYIYGDRDVAKSDAGRRMPACAAALDRILGRRVNYVVPATRQLDRDVAKSDAGRRMPAGLEKIQGRMVNYVVPAMRQLV